MRTTTVGLASRARDEKRDASAPWASLRRDGQTDDAGLSRHGDEANLSHWWLLGRQCYSERALRVAKSMSANRMPFLTR